MIKICEDIILNEADISIITTEDMYEPCERSKFYILAHFNKIDKYKRVQYTSKEERDKWFTYIEKQLISLGKMIEF